MLPVNPSTHEQLNPLASFTHVAPLRHGDDEHASGGIAVRQTERQTRKRHGW